MRRSRTTSCSASAARYSTTPSRTTSSSGRSSAAAPLLWDRLPVADGRRSGVPSAIPALQPLPQRAEVLRGLRAVERAVVPREAEDRLRADLDHVAAIVVLDDDSPLDDRLEVEDRDLRLVDHRR